MDQANRQPPLRLFWWKGKPNFGDALSQIVTAHAAGRPVQHAKPGHCEMFALGSILQIARRKYQERKPTGYRPWIWGSGMMEALPRDFLPNVRIAMVRGPITASLLGLNTELFGDPGLLTADALGPVETRGDHTGLLIHHSQLGDPRIQAALQADTALRYIDVQGAPEDVCRQIAGCRHVISSSLHGLVVADAYGIANTWLDPEKHARLKYYDYAAAIGRALPLPLPLAEIAAALPRLPDGPLNYTDGIDAAKARLMEHFPADLRGSPETEPAVAGVEN